MENASKALLMAAGILIGLTIIVIGVILFSSFSKFASTYEETSIESDITKFNSNFTKFIERDDIKPQEIVTLINFIKENNYEGKVKVYVNGTEKTTTDTINFLQETMERTYTYVSHNEDEETALVSKIFFRENS